MKAITRYRKCKTDPQKIAWLLAEMKRDVGFGNLIEKVNKDTYRIGPRWDEVDFPKRLFDVIKPFLKIYKEVDEGQTYTYWELK